MTNALTLDAEPLEAFRHEALFYDGLDEFVDRTAAFVRQGTGTGEAVLVVVTADKIDVLREAVGPDEGVAFADMADVGRNPARIIPAWQHFVDEHTTNGRRVRGVGEPIFAARTPDELTECQRHEVLLNVAFAGAPAWWLVCPYDLRSLDESVLAEAHRSHPVLSRHGNAHDSHSYHHDTAVAAVFDGALPEPQAPFTEIIFDAAMLSAVRRFVRAHATAAGLDVGRTDDVVLAVHELATNSVRHGGGKGVLRMWETDQSVVCEVRDNGHVAHPLVGRVRPDFDDESGRGLWLVNHLCDLVQVRSSADETVVRVHMSVQPG